MTHATLSHQLATKALAIMLAVAFNLMPTQAQTGTEIMVNGPWSFVRYQNRLYIVAGWNKYHFVNIWSGPKAQRSYWIDSLGDKNFKPQLICPSGNPPAPCSANATNIYTLNFNGVANGANTFNEEVEDAYQSTVDPATVPIILNNPSVSRYAISLPPPDHMHTYSGDFGPGVAESKIQPKTDPDETVPFLEKATWTVLGYNSKATSATLSNGTSSFSVDVSAGEDDRTGVRPDGTSNKIQRLGISISLMESPLCADSDSTHSLFYPQDCPSAKSKDYFSPANQDESECDTLSSLSFAQSASLWGLSEHARFPSEQHSSDPDADPDYTGGTQSPWNIDYGCMAAYAGDLVDLEKLQDLVVQNNITKADLAAEIVALKSKLGMRVPSQELRKKMTSKSPFELLLGIAKDLSGERIDWSAEDKTHAKKLESQMYCACEAITRGKGRCSLFAKKAEHRCGKDNLQILKDFWHAADLVLASAWDKGMGDCHASQVSINGALYPTYP